MTIANRRIVLSGLGATLLSACAARPEVADADRDEPRGGIGGTGIVGVLTSFGSLIVNGERVETTSATVVEGPLGPLSPEDLAIGQALTIEAAPVGGVLTAARVFVADPLIGAIEAISGDRRRLRVLGVDVAVDPGASVEGALGDRVAVSGLWRGESVAASRVAATGTGADAIAGVIGRAPDGAATIGGRRVDMLIRIAVPAEGTFVVARGAAVGPRFEVRALSIGRFVGAAGPLERLSIEGYLDPTGAAPFYEVSGLGHSFDAAARLAPFSGGRSLFEGGYEGTFAVDTALPLPEDAGARADLLEAVRFDPALRQSLRRSAR